MMITLYQMPVSHFCEKARWALAYKRVPHKYKNLLPGLHRQPAMKLSGQSSVPIIKDGKQVIAGSQEIISFLDAEHPRFALTPERGDDRSEALRWEALADEKIGPAVRILAYSIFLERPDLLIPMFGYQGPWYKSFVLNRAFPKIKAALTKRLPINEDSIETSRAALTQATNEIKKALSDGSMYLVGDAFSRADLAVAALLAPLYQPDKYGLAWPDSVPVALQKVREEFSDLRPWVMEIYQKHRVVPRG